MRNHRHRSFPVVEDDRLVGIITRGDVMKISSSRTNLFVEGVMSNNLETAKEDEDIQSCAKKMLKTELNQLPVVAGEDKLIGVVCGHDLLSALLEQNHRPQKKNVSDIMTEDVVSCSPDDELLSIWDKMQSSGFSGFPVVLKKKVVGMITRMDIIREGSVRVSKESGKGRTVHVKKAMKTPPITIKAGAEIREAAEVMLKNKIIRLPAVDEKDNIVGIVDLGDVLKAYVG
jgi:CBS domain-containing protein